MKKLVCKSILFVLIGVLACAKGKNKTPPAFTGENAENAFIIDVRSYETKKIKLSTTLKIINYASDKPINFTVYKWDDKNGYEVEEPVGIDFFGISHEVGGTRKFVTSMVLSSSWARATGFLKLNDYVAIVPVGQRDYSYKIEVNDDGTMTLLVLPKDASFETLGKGAVEFDILKIIKDKKAKNSSTIKVAMRSEAMLKENFYLFGNKGNGYEFLGATKNGFLLDVNVEKLSKCSRLAIACADGKPYQYSFEIEKINSIASYFKIVVED